MAKSSKAKTATRKTNEESEKESAKKSSSKPKKQEEDNEDEDDDGLLHDEDVTPVKKGKATTSRKGKGAIWY